MLAFPVYDETLDLVHVLTSYGFILAHEIGHGFDDNGASYGSLGLVENMWSAKTEKRFGVSFSCMGLINCSAIFSLVGREVRGGVHDRAETID